MTSWTAAHQAPLPMEFSRQEYWRGLQLPSPGDLPKPGISVSLVSPALGGGFLMTAPPGKPQTAGFRGIQNWTQVSAATELSPAPPPGVRRSLSVPCLSLVEKRDSPRPPRSRESKCKPLTTMTTGSQAECLLHTPGLFHRRSACQRGTEPAA